MQNGNKMKSKYGIELVVFERSEKKFMMNWQAGRQAGSSLQMLNSFSLEMFVIFRVSSNETIAVGAQENTHTNLFLSAFFPSHSRG